MVIDDQQIVAVAVNDHVHERMCVC